MELAVASPTAYETRPSDPRMIAAEAECYLILPG
jgi:hypothetical protein